MKKIFYIGSAFLCFNLLCLPVAQGQNQTYEQYGIKGIELKPVAYKSSQARYTVKGKTYQPLTEQQSIAYSQEGIGSYYHSKFNGRKTASGEIYRSTLFTAAHKTLPLNYYALVTNLANNKKVIVRINDRGPFSQDRIIDLSYAAAKELGLVTQGIGKVKVEALKVAEDGKILGPAAKSLVNYAKSKEARDRLGLEQDSTITAYRIKLLNLSSQAETEKILADLDVKNLTININKEGNSYQLSIDGIQETQLNQLKIAIQKQAKGKPLFVYSNN